MAGDNPGDWLRQVARHLSADFRTRIGALGVNPSEWLVLRVLAAGPRDLKSLSAELQVNPGATSRLVERLARRQLLRRTRGLADRRAVQLTLLASGHRLLARIAREADLGDAHYFTKLSGADRQALTRIMRTLAATHGVAAPGPR